MEGINFYISGRAEGKTTTAIDSMYDRNGLPIQGRVLVVHDRRWAQTLERRHPGIRVIPVAQLTANQVGQLTSELVIDNLDLVLPQLLGGMWRVALVTSTGEVLPLRDIPSTGEVLPLRDISQEGEGAV